MKRVIFLLLTAIIFSGCSKDDDNTKEIPFAQDGKYSGKIQYPDGKILRFTLAFNSNLTYSFQVKTPNTSRDDKRLVSIKGTYSYNELSNGVFNIDLSDTAEIQYGYSDIVESPIDVNNLGTLFPLKYALTITITNESYGQYYAVNLVNTDYSQGYSIQATVWED